MRLAAISDFESPKNILGTAIIILSDFTLEMYEEIFAETIILMCRVCGISASCCYEV